MSTVDGEGLAEWWADKVGRRVVLRYMHGREEVGVVTSVNAKYVFVRFGSKVGSESCDPRQLRLEMPL